MTRIMTTAALVGLFALPVAAQDISQLVAAAGISPVEAQGMTLTEIAAAKFNRDGDRDAAQTVFAADGDIAVDPVRHAQLIAAANLGAEDVRGLSLSDLAAGKYNAEVAYDERQGQVTMSSRGAARAVPTQLIAAAGLTPAEARGQSLNDLYVLKINREADRDERQGY